MERAMNASSTKRQGFRWTRKRNRRALLAAVGTLALASTSHAATSLWFDNNGATSGLGSGAGTWNATNTNWATTSNPGTTAPGVWSAGAIANFNANFTVTLGDIEQVGGLVFNGGG